jgi:pimeloyl-ACP methyl ester carboxylesterase
MATFVLVHGSFFASWCWREVTPRLERRGHRVVTLDLPAHGENRMPVERVTLGDYVEAALAVVRAQEKPSILVGHSMGAAVASLAELELDAVAALVFVAGLLPPSGGTLMEGVGQLDPEYLAQAVWASDRRSVWISPEGTREFVCSMCPRDIVDEVIRRMTPEPIAPYEAPIVTTSGRFGPVPRFFVETLRDKVAPLPLQRSVQEQAGFRHVLSVDADHAPFFSAPEALASSLEMIAAEV